MKDIYETPNCEVVEFETEDVITTSGEPGDLGNEDQQNNLLEL